MWVLKLKSKTGKFFLGNCAIKHNIDLVGYPLSYYKDKKNIHMTFAGFMIGEEKNKKRLLKNIKKLKEVVNLEFYDNFGIIVVKEPLYMESIFNPKFIMSKPMFVSHEGYHIWEIASWDKKSLLKIIKFAKKYHKAEILKLKQEKLKNISFTSILPNLSDKQKKAFELAILKGYYSYPRKIKLEELAKLMKISYSTFQEHLRRAEEKLIPSFS